MNQYIQIGICGKAHGLKGAIKVRIKDPFLKNFGEASVIFMEDRGAIAPFFVESISLEEEPFLKVEELTSREAAHKFYKRKILMRESDLRNVDINPVSIENDFELFTNFQVEVLDVGMIGSIKEVVEYPQQIMAFVQSGKKEIMIPLNEHFIREIDPEKKIILMELPEGLLEL